MEQRTSKTALSYIVLASLLSTLFVRCQESSSCVCGKSKIGARIIGGDQAQQGEFPWQVALITPQYFQFCGGSLINDRWVMTAAHCVYNKQMSEVMIVLSTNDLDLAPARSIGVSKILVHPQYSGPPNQRHDLALIQLSRNLRLSALVTPVCLPDSTMLSFTNLNAVGWGAVVNKGRGVKNLKHVSLRQRSQAVCTQLYGPQRFTREHICANDIGRDVCNGDSGGPLTTISRGSTYVVGVVSWGIICGQYRLPSVFTRVTTYLDWIQSEASDGATWCPSS